MHEARMPRERAAREGLGALEDRELLALLLGTGHGGRAAVELADDVLDLAQGCLGNLASWPIEGLTLVHGIGRAKATLVAAAMVLVHNHPSGNPKPSAADRSLTATLCKAGEFLDLPVLDHVIVGGDAFVSFADQGWLT